MNKNRKVIAVELDPPKNDQIAAYMKNVSLLASSGADFVTIADCPIGRSRADSCLLACKIKRELGVLALPHMTCRDRNLNATKALLLGLAMEDIHSMLLVTGDPLPTDLRDEVKSVFSFNSRKLAAYIKGLYPETVSIPFNMFGALNVNALNFEKQLEIALEKEKAGISGFLTQPVLSSQALQNLKLARKKLKGKILGGIFPVVSYKNGLFLKNEVSGIDVSDEIIERYKGLDRSQGEDLALQISADIAAEIAPYVDGFYLMTPFSRVNLMVRLIDRIKKDGLLKKQL
ncbi:MAG: methylenetetrahydrofolate reductase [Erysipelotrichaceae bacterium]|nr:methylenetetrahydrofolate reductase [Erysipelotrichaceae bacterium]